MQGIYYLLSIVAVFVVFVWYVRNDRVSSGEPTRGLLAINDPTAPPPEPKRRWKPASVVPKKATLNH